jgi:hypothetical protein
MIKEFALVSHRDCAKSFVLLNCTLKLPQLNSYQETEMSNSRNRRRWHGSGKNAPTRAPPAEEQFPALPSVSSGAKEEQLPHQDPGDSPAIPASPFRVLLPERRAQIAHEAARYPAQNADEIACNSRMINHFNAELLRKEMAVTHSTDSRPELMQKADFLRWVVIALEEENIVREKRNFTE